MVGNSLLIETFGVQEVVHEVLVLLFCKAVVPSLSHSIMLVVVQGGEFFDERGDIVLGFFGVQSITLVLKRVVHDDVLPTKHQVHIALLNNCVNQWQDWGKICALVICRLSHLLFRENSKQLRNELGEQLRRVQIQ